MSGGLAANPKSVDVPDTGKPVATTACFSNTPVYTVNIVPTTENSNVYANVDYEFVYTPKNYSEYYDSSWTPGSAHNLGVPAVEYPYSVTSRFNFSKWSDGGAMSHTITSLPGAAKTYTATTLKVSLNAADVASPGAFQVFAENYTSGSTGCAVVGYRAFLVEGKGVPAAKPVFSLKAVTYPTTQSVTIADALAGATFYYTTDGTTPTTSSPVYSGPLAVGSTEILKADATAAGYVRSAIASATYTIKSP